MFWLSSDEQKDEQGGRPCALTWTRTVAGLDGSVRETVEGAVWRQRGRAHYLSYDESMNGQGTVRTTLRLESDALTWIRHGVVTWTHTFRRGERHASQLMLGKQSIAIETTTRALDIDVQPDGGHIRLIYDMQMADETTHTDLTLDFHTVL